MEGSEVGDFFIKRNIGEGSLGPVYLAEHRFIKKLFALKCIPKKLIETKSFKDTFSEEIGKIAKLQHPNIASIHNVSYFEDKLFIVSDYVRYKFPNSMNLGAYLATFPERLKEEEILQILKEVAFALDYIHGEKVLAKPMFHGGLKLSNILLSEVEGGKYKIMLSDTGIIPMLGSSYVLKNMMKIFLSSEENSSKEEQYKKAFMQTYAFLAPEQRFISGNKMTYKCDSYSFGVLAYFLLMGMLPEGSLLMPSAVYKNSGINWDMIIKATLKNDPVERVDNLTQLLKDAQDMTPLEDVNIPTSEKRSEVFVDVNSAKSEERVFVAAEDPYRAQEKAFHSLERQVRESSSAALMSPRLLDKQQTDFTGQNTVGLEDARKQAQRLAFLKEQQEKEQLEKALQEKQEQERIEKEKIQKELARKEALERKEKSKVNQLEQNLMGNISPTARVTTMKKNVVNTPEQKEEKEIDPRLLFQRDSEVRNYKPVKKDVGSINPILTDTVSIPEGEYERGSLIGGRDEKPRHKVFVDSFEIDIHPVTNEQFLQFLLVVEDGQEAFNHDIILLKESRIKKQAGELLIETGYAKHPVVGVSYYGAQAYAEWVGKKLPTEAQWEIAASMGKSENIYPTGEQIERVQANFFSSDTIPVMSYPPTKNGLYDMAGNVYEWCEDWYDYNYYETSMSEPKNPAGPKQGVYRVLRGGCWKSLADDLRCAHRFRNNPGSMNRTYGFRCVSKA